ncbi:jerky protein [Phytophthora cinnamomi]|uniref:jerky protein n=1 Tax=Phytophthora cinnamomi TaxID=4785 RepID=UPI003559E452|nr:jerky protein [Phytophthora cinnamomi]
MITSHAVEATRTRVTLPFDAKIQIIQRLEAGEGIKHILEDYGVSAISKLIKNKTRILEMVANAEDCAVLAKKNLPRVTTSPDTKCDSTQPPAKRKHVTTTLRQKHQILERLESGEAQADIGAAYNISLQQLNKIETNKTVVMTRCAEGQDAADLERKDLAFTFMAKSRDNTDIKKRVVISLADKAAILKCLEIGDVQKAIAEDFGVSAQQMSRIKKAKHLILIACANAEDATELERKTIPTVDASALRDLSPPKMRKRGKLSDEDKAAVFKMVTDQVPYKDIADEFGKCQPDRAHQEEVFKLRWRMTGSASMINF